MLVLRKIRIQNTRLDRNNSEECRIQIQLVRTIYDVRKLISDSYRYNRKEWRSNWFEY